MSKPEAVPSANQKTSVRIPISEIYIDPKFNTRDPSQEAEIGKLSESLSKDGQLTPVLVHPYKGKGNFKYELTIGFRRTAAATMLKWTEIEAKILDAAPSEQERKILNLVENMQRKDLAPFEFAEACAALVEGGMKGPAIAQRVGVSPGHVNNMVRLKQKLHPECWKALRHVREGVRTGNDVTLQWLLQVVALPHDQQLEKLKEKLGTEGSGGGEGGSGATGGSGGGGDGGDSGGIRAPSKKKVQDYLEALKTIPKAERSEHHDEVVKAIKWCRGLVKNPPIKVVPRAEEE